MQRPAFDCDPVERAALTPETQLLPTSWRFVEFTLAEEGRPNDQLCATSELSQFLVTRFAQVVAPRLLPQKMKHFHWWNERYIGG
jgi:hypothetical protein